MGKMRYICHPELRRRGKGPETSMRRKAIPRKMKRHKCLVNMFAMLCGDIGTERNLISRSC